MTPGLLVSVRKGGGLFTKGMKTGRRKAFLKTAFQNRWNYVLLKTY